VRGSIPRLPTESPKLYGEVLGSNPRRPTWPT